MNPQNIIDKNILDLQVKPLDFAVILEESRKQKKFTDVQLQVGDQSFYAHRVVLAAYSPVLKAMLSDKWSKICPISDVYVSPSIVEPLLHFLYTGSIQLTPDNVHPVCVAAHFLQISEIPTLLESSVQHLGRLISVKNVLTVFKFYAGCQWKTLRYPCLQFITNNHEKVFQDPQILEFSSEIFNELITGLKRRNRPIKKLKESTFDCIVRWTEVNLSKRLDLLPVLLKNIPLEDLSFKFLTETVSKHPLVKVSPSCIETVSVALANTGKERNDNLVIFSRDGQKMACYDFQTEVWKDLPHMLEPRLSFSATVVNRKDIVVCGGNSHRKTELLDTVEMFEWSSQTWKPLPAMPLGRWQKSCSIAALDGRLYVIGKHAYEASNKVVCFSFETQRWEYVKPMNIARKEVALVEYDGYLYVFGGWTDTIERYDPLFDEWTCISDLPINDRYFEIRHMTVHQNRIYACCSGDFEEYNPDTHSWRIGFSKKKFKCNGSLVSSNGRLLHMLGAEDGTKSIYEYDFWDKKWKKFLEKDFSEYCILIAGRFY